MGDGILRFDIGYLIRLYLHFKTNYRDASLLTLCLSKAIPYYRTIKPKNKIIEKPHF